MKKRIFSWFLTLVMVLGMVPVTAFAEESNSITAYVTIANKGKLEIAHKAVTVADRNNDGNFDVDETLYAAHEAFYDGGAESGYWQEDFWLKKLWGDDSEAFGYYVNDDSARSLGDAVKAGDNVVAFVYKDSTAWSDQYCFFNESSKSAVLTTSSTSVEFTISFDKWGQKGLLSGATITVNERSATDTEGNRIVTDEDGNATLTFHAEGTYLVSAEKDGTPLVPPVCIVTVSKEGNAGGEGSSGGTGGTGSTVKPPASDTLPLTKKEKEAKVNALLNNIAKSYKDSSSEWHVIGMAAYEDILPECKYKTSQKAKQAYIDYAIQSMTENGAGDTTYGKAIIGLTALGIDAERLYTVNSNEPISAIEGLNGVEKDSNVWKAVYTMAAYNQKAYSGTEQYENVLIEKVLKNQANDGRWNDYGTKIDSTANAIIGLSFYKENDAVSEALARAVAFLRSAQCEDGKFDNGFGPEANATAMAVLGFCAAGVNPDAVVKNDVSALDALLSFALEDSSGFGYSDNSELNDYATYQAFFALIAAKQVIDTGNAFNIYDFSHNSDSIVPGRATGSDSASKPSAPPQENEDITVTMTIRPDVGYWMRNKSVTVDEGSTVYHAFIKALEGSGITQKGAESGYVSEMSYGGKTLGEFDEGENSGWLYKVNGELPDVGLTSYKIEDGDSILWYYTEDWTKDHDAGSRREEEVQKANKEAAQNVSDLISGLGKVSLASKEAIEAARAAYDALTEEQKKLVDIEALLQAEEAYAALMAAAEEETAEAAPAPVQFTDVREESYYYDAVNWAAANGIVSGVTEGVFAPEETCSRGQIAAFLWRLAGCPAPETKVVPYTDVETDSYYHDAILWATENGIVKGMDGRSFNPETVLTRAQAVVFLWRAAGMPAPSGEQAFTDVPETAYYHDAVLWAAENGITSGTGEGMFSPDTPCNRGQIVTFLYRAFEE